MASDIRISRADARRFLIHYQGLDGRLGRSSEAGVLDYFRHVGCIQYDPLDVVGRNADLVLQARFRGYRPMLLEKMLYTDRSLIDGWDKMMAIYRREDWPFFTRVRARKRREVEGVLAHRGSREALALTRRIREILDRGGPHAAAQIDLGRGGNGRWGHRGLSGAALDYMFNAGEVGVYAKRGAQKTYHLIEELLPCDLLASADPFPDESAFTKWYVRRRVGGVGLLWGRNGGAWLGHFISDKETRARLLSELVADGHLVPVSIEGIGEPFYARTEDRPLLEAAPKPPREVRILAPLDNLLWDRSMVEELFGFRYSWEVYLPASRRTYGYYVLPVLYGDRLVARFEPESQRGDAPLRISRWWWEEGGEVTASMRSAAERGLKRFAAYAGAGGVSPASMRRLEPLRRARGVGPKTSGV